MIDNVVDNDIDKLLRNITNELRSHRPLPRTAELFAGIRNLKRLKLYIETKQVHIVRSVNEVT